MAKGKGTSQTDKIDKKLALLEAAMEVFAQRGYKSATMDEIAKRAGVGKGTAYLYFANKAALFFEVFEFWNQKAMEISMKSVALAKTPAEALKGLALGAAEFMEQNREWFPLTLEVWSAAGSSELRELFSQALQQLYALYRAETAKIISQGQEMGKWRSDLSAESLAALLTGAIDGLFIQCWFDSSLDARTMLVDFFDVLEKGMIQRNSK